MCIFLQNSSNMNLQIDPDVVHSGVSSFSFSLSECSSLNLFLSFGEYNVFSFISEWREDGMSGILLDAVDYFMLHLYYSTI